MKKPLLLVFLVLLSTFVCLSNIEGAQEGVTDRAILMGIQGYTGEPSADHIDMGLEIVFKEINNQGGIHGRKVQFLNYLRQGGMEGALECAKRLTEEDRVFCLFSFGGMPQAMKLVPYVMEKKKLFLFPHQGSDTLAGKRYIFTSFPFYKSESDIMLKYLVQTRGLKRIGIIYADNAYGYMFRDKLRENAPKLGCEIAGEQPVKEYDPADVLKEMQALKNSKAQAVLMPLYVRQALKALEAKGKLDWKDLIPVSTGPLTDEKHFHVVGEFAEGMIGLCLYPDPTHSQEQGVVEYRKLMKKYYLENIINRYSLYGYVYGKLIAEGLVRAGRNLTTESYVDAMESIKNWENGGIIPPVTFSNTDHHAQDAGYIGELRGGKFRPITDWIGID